MRQLSAHVTRQLAGCKDGPCPNWYQLADGDYLFQGDEVATVEGLRPQPGQALIRVPRALLREGLAVVDTGDHATAVWVELDEENLVFVGPRVTDEAVLAGIAVSPGETFIRVSPASITTTLASLAGAA